MAVLVPENMFSGDGRLLSDSQHPRRALVSFEHPVKGPGDLVVQGVVGGAGRLGKAGTVRGHAVHHVEFVHRQPAQHQVDPGIHPHLG